MATSPVKPRPHAGRERRRAAEGAHVILDARQDGARPGRARSRTRRSRSASTRCRGWALVKRLAVAGRRRPRCAPYCASMSAKSSGGAGRRRRTGCLLLGVLAADAVLDPLVDEAQVGQVDQQRAEPIDEGVLGGEARAHAAHQRGRVLRDPRRQRRPGIAPPRPGAPRARSGPRRPARPGTAGPACGDRSSSMARTLGACAGSSSSISLRRFAYRCAVRQNAGSASNNAAAHSQLPGPARRRRSDASYPSLGARFPGTRGPGSMLGRRHGRVNIAISGVCPAPFRSDRGRRLQAPPRRVRAARACRGLVAAC